MKENGPFVPRVVERALQLLYVRYHAEAALGVGMGKRISPNGYWLGDLGRYASGQIEQSFGGLTRQVVREFQQRVLIGAAYVGHPLRRYAVPQQLLFRDGGEQRLLRRCDTSGDGLFHFNVSGNGDLLHRLPNLDKLRGSGLGMSFEPPALRPLVSVIVMAHVAEQQAGFGLMHDQPDIAVYPNRPESAVLGLVEPMELQTRMSRVQLEIERCRLDGFLLIARQLRKAVGKSVGDAKFHSVSVYSLFAFSV